MHIEALRLETGEPVCDRQKLFTYGCQMLQSFFQPEVGEVVGTDLVAQEGRELFVLLDEGVLPIGPEEMMAGLDLSPGGLELSLQFLGQAGAEDLSDLVSGHPPQTHLAGTLEDFVDR